MNMSPSFERSPTDSLPDKEVEVTSKNSPDLYVTSFEAQRELIQGMFKIDVPYERALKFPWVKDEIYREVIKDIEDNKYFALIAVLHEGILTKEDLTSRGIGAFKDHAYTILRSYKGFRYMEAREILVDSGILTEQEAQQATITH